MHAFRTHIVRVVLHVFDAIATAAAAVVVVVAFAVAVSKCKFVGSVMECAQHNSNQWFVDTRVVECRRIL